MTFLISGAGLAGLCLARRLKNLGLEYTIIEKKSSLAAIGAGIALPANAVRALRYTGLSEFVDGLHQVQQVTYSSSDGCVISAASLLKEPLNRDKFVALDRAQLLTGLQQDLVDDIHFNATITGMKQRDSGVDVRFTNSALDGHYQAVVGADGAYSTVRELGFGVTQLVDLGVTTWRWICEWPTDGVQPNYMLGTKNMLLIYPIGPNRIYCYAHQSDKAGRYNHSDEAGANIQQLFASYQGMAKSLLTILPENKLIYTGRLRSVPTPLFSQGDCALIGDAGHVCSPMLQQGAALAFEDAWVLSELLAHFSVRKALENYRTQREQRVNWIVKTSDASIRSFVKMNSRWSVILRNWLIKYKGPLNAAGWAYLLNSCPLDNVLNLICSSRPTGSASFSKR